MCGILLSDMGNFSPLENVFTSGFVSVSVEHSNERQRIHRRFLSIHISSQ